MVTRAEKKARTVSKMTIGSFECRQTRTVCVASCTQRAAIWAEIDVPWTGTACGAALVWHVASRERRKIAPSDSSE
jgi:hypothetical protein